MEKLMTVEDILRMQLAELQAENKKLLAELEDQLVQVLVDPLAEQVRLEMCGD